MSLTTFFIAVFVLAITPGPGIAYVVARTATGGVPKAWRCASARAHAARARWMTALSGVTMLGLGAWPALARREA